MASGPRHATVGPHGAWRKVLRVAYISDFVVYGIAIVVAAAMTVFPTRLRR